MLTLHKKANESWWSVIQPDGRKGFIPASYVTELEPYIQERVTLEPVKVMKKVKVTKTEYRKEPKRRRSLRRAPSRE